MPHYGQRLIKLVDLTSKELSWHHRREVRYLVVLETKNAAAMMWNEMLRRNGYPNLGAIE